MSAKREFEGMVYGKRGVAIGATLKVALGHWKKLECGETLGKRGFLKGFKKESLEELPQPRGVRFSREREYFLDGISWLEALGRFASISRCFRK